MRWLFLLRISFFSYRNPPEIVKRRLTTLSRDFKIHAKGSWLFTKIVDHGISILKTLMYRNGNRSCVKQENVEVSSIPPGFESSTPFSVKKAETKEVKTSNSGNSRSESGDDSNSKALPLGPRLLLGVIRGCDDCENCQKVTARWLPGGACKTDLEEVPVFYPTEEVMTT